MANKDQPVGFRPYGETRMAVLVEAGSAIYPGDAIALASDGQCDAVVAGADIYGVALGYASAAGVKVLASVHPQQVYVVQGSSTQIDAQTDIGTNFDVLATAGNSTYKISRHELDTASQTGAGTSAQLNLLGILRNDDNAFGDNLDVLVVINEHQIFGEDSSGGV